MSFRVMHVLQDPLACLVPLSMRVFGGQRAAMSLCHCSLSKRPKEKKSNKLSCYMFQKKENNDNNNNRFGY